jgi:hypothetical protein
VHAHGVGWADCCTSGNNLERCPSGALRKSLQWMRRCCFHWLHTLLPMYAGFSSAVYNFTCREGIASPFGRPSYSGLKVSNHECMQLQSSQNSSALTAWDMLPIPWCACVLITNLPNVLGHTTDNRKVAAPDPEPAFTYGLCEYLCLKLR